MRIRAFFLNPVVGLAIVILTAVARISGLYAMYLAWGLLAALVWTMVLGFTYQKRSSVFRLPFGLENRLTIEFIVALVSILAAYSAWGWLGGLIMALLYALVTFIPMLVLKHLNPSMRILNP